MEKTALIAGHICLDITPIFSNTSTITTLGEILLPGKLIQMNNVDIHTGGAVSNTGLGMKVLGANVKLLAKIGSDNFGTIIREALNKYNAGNDLIETASANTSYTIVLSVPGIDRIFLHCPGANDTFVWEDIPKSLLTDTSLFHFGYPPLMKKQYENNGQELLKIFHEVRNLGIATSLDMASIDSDSNAAKANWNLILSRILPFVDFFVPSYEELCFMLDHNKYIKLQNIAHGQDITKFLDIEKDIRPLAEMCLNMGANSVLLKCGSMGMYLTTSNHMETVGERLALNPAQWNSFSKFQNSFPIDNIVSSTGAGDTSIAAFLCSLLNGYDPLDSLRHAAGAGALCCTAYDAISGLKPLSFIHNMVSKVDFSKKEEYVNAL